MTAVLIVIAVIVCIGFIRVGVIAEYSADGPYVSALAGPVRIQLVPPKKKKAQKKKKEPKKKKKDKTDTEGKKKGGSFRKIMDLLPGAFSALKKFFKNLRIDELTIEYTAANEDPYKAAMSYGSISAGMGVLIPLLENTFKIKKRDFRSDVSFTEKEPIVYIRARLTISIGRLIAIALGFLIYFIKTSNRKVDTNG